MKRRIFLVVLDGFGVGEAPDAYKYGDEGSNTFLNLYKVREMQIPTLTKLGLKNIDGINIQTSTDNLIGSFGKLEELSAGKDTTTGHFEMMDIISKDPMPTYPNGFSSEVVEKLVKAWGVSGVLANCAGSGTELVKKYGDEHLKTHKPILYTSADSVLQVATHTSIFPLEKLYEMCKQARQIMQGKDVVDRIIARPFFTNEKGEYERLNTGRRDYSLMPPTPNTMERMIKHDLDVIAVGKIEDIFNHQNITKSYVNHTNPESLEVLKQLSKEEFNGLCFVNLVDTDMLYGHRNDIEGYARAIEKVDKVLPVVIDNMNNQDYLIITGDHGCDPTTISSDHSREYTPLLVFSKEQNKVHNFGTLKGFNNIGKFIEKLFGITENSAVYDILNKGE